MSARTTSSARVIHDVGTTYKVRVISAVRTINGSTNHTTRKDQSDSVSQEPDVNQIPGTSRLSGEDQRENAMTDAYPHLALRLLKKMREYGALLSCNSDQMGGHTYWCQNRRVSSSEAEGVLFGNAPPLVQVITAAEHQVDYGLSAMGQHAADIGSIPEYISQGMGDTCCFVYAVMNHLSHEGHCLPDFDMFKDVAHCRDGSTINEQAVLDLAGLDLAETDDMARVVERGGILRIMHPIWNLHSVAVAPVGKSMWAFNSWLGPTVMRVGSNVLSKFAPTTPVYWVKPGESRQA